MYLEISNIRLVENYCIVNGSLDSEDRRPLEKEDPLENKDLENEDPLEIISVRRKIDGTMLRFGNVLIMLN